MAFEGLQTAVACILHVSTLLDARVGTVDGLGKAPIVPVIGLHADKLIILADATLAARGALLSHNVLRNLENIRICATATKTIVTTRRGKRPRFTGLTAWCTSMRRTEISSIVTAEERWHFTQFDVFYFTTAPKYTYKCLFV